MGWMPGNEMNVESSSKRMICKLRPRFIACFRFISGGPLSCVQLRTGVNMRMKPVLILLLLVGVSGCRSTSMEYDLSTSAPFSAYSNLTVELRKPMILFKDHQGQYELHGINPEDMRTGIVLPTGYKVTVLNTCLYFQGSSGNRVGEFPTILECLEGAGQDFQP